MIAKKDRYAVVDVGKHYDLKNGATLCLVRKNKYTISILVINEKIYKVYHYEAKKDDDVYFIHEDEKIYLKDFKNTYGSKKFKS